jgi:predicted amidohydrolase YtcJ
VNPRRGRPIAIVNGSVFTAARERPWAHALLIDDGVIVAVGTNEEVLAYGPSPLIIDAEGRTVIPGLIDAHNHFLATGESMGMLDVRFPEVRSVAGLVGKVAQAVPVKARGETVSGYGYDDAKYERRPTRWDLDEVAPDNPVVIGHVSGHYVLANSAAMEARGLREPVDDPPGGEIDRDGEGRMTGIFRDAAIALVQPTAVEIGHHGPNFHVRAEPHDLLAAVDRAGRAYLEAGLTTVCDAQVTARELRAYREARGRGRLHVRTVCMPLSHQLADYQALGLAGPFGDDWLAIGPMKFYCDGSLIGGSAAFSEPYGADGEFPGLLFWEPGELVEAIVAAHRDGWQVGVHAQGDLAIGIALDAFERSLAARGDGDPRFRVEHAGYPTHHQLLRFRELGVIVVAQPSYLHDSGDDFLERLPERAHHLQPLRSALDLGIPVALSSDSDVASYKPLDTIASAVQRRTFSGAPIGPAESLTVAEAVRAHTIGAAFSIRAERRLGSIEVGKLADVVIVGGDLFGSEPEALRALPIAMTIVGGSIVHRLF